MTSRSDRLCPPVLGSHSRERYRTCEAMPWAARRSPCRQALVAPVRLKLAASRTVDVRAIRGVRKGGSPPERCCVRAENRLAAHQFPRHPMNGSPTTAHGTCLRAQGTLVKALLLLELRPARRRDSDPLRALSSRAVGCQGVWEFASSSPTCGGRHSPGLEAASSRGIVSHRRLLPCS